MHDLWTKLNPTLPREKQHSTRRLLDQKLGIKFKEETSQVLNLWFLWCGKLDSSESRLELLRTFSNVVLQKDRGDQLNWSFKNKDVLKRIAEKKNILHTIKQTKPNWTRHPFTTLNQQNAHNFFLDIYVTISPWIRSLCQSCRSLSRQKLPRVHH
jgi:hypothetical protein